MMHNLPITRRHLLAGSGAIALSSALPVPSSIAKNHSNDSFRGLKVGLASYSTRKFTLDQTIEMLKDCDVHYVTLKSFHLPMDSTTEERKAVAEKLKNNDIHLMGGGVISLKNDEDQVRSAFQYAKDAGMPVMVSAPEIEALPIVHEMVKEFDIKVAIHNHGPGDKRYPSPLDAYRHAQKYDKRIGICIDIGHSVRWGDNEIEIIHAVRDRLYDFHIKDETARAPEGKTLEVGRGVIDIPGVLKTLLDIKFDGHLALEYEKDADDPLPGMRESFGFIKGVLAVI